MSLKICEKHIHYHIIYIEENWMQLKNQVKEDV